MRRPPRLRSPPLPGTARRHPVAPQRTVTTLRARRVTGPAWSRASSRVGLRMTYAAPLAQRGAASTPISVVSHEGASGHTINNVLFATTPELAKGGVAEPPTER
jgi:hypothetical protein